MLIFKSHIFLLLLALVTAKLGRKQGWLDRMVAYQKKAFLEDFKKLPPITVSVDKAPPGFVDSPHWTKESVLRLVMLIDVLDLQPAKQLIRRALRPLNGRRFFYLPPGKNSFDFFPSLSKDHHNNFEYDDMVNYPDNKHSGETTHNERHEVDDNTVVIISNPVESRLPGSMISVGLLRQLMEERALGLRQLPTSSTTRATFPPRNTTRTTTKAGTSTDGADAGGTKAGGTDAVSTDAGGASDATASEASTPQTMILTEGDEESSTDAAAGSEAGTTAEETPPT